MFIIIVYYANLIYFEIRVNHYLGNLIITKCYFDFWFILEFKILSDLNYFYLEIDRK
jgi:hypothetical protein